MATKQTSEGTTLLKYTLNMKHPEAIEITAPARDTQSDKIDLSLKEFEKKITQRDTLSSENLASNDLQFYNKNNSMHKEVWSFK